MYIKDFLNKNYSSKLFDKFWGELEWERRPDAPRREYWTNIFDRDYTYGKGAGVRTYQPKPGCPEIWDISVYAELEAEDRDLTPTASFEGCFLNGYEGARDWLGWHSDDDPAINHNQPIAIVTLYREPDKQPRTIQFRDNTTQVIETVELHHGSLYLMPPGFQFTHQHRIPKAGFDCSDRISLTYRGLI
jgi:alkylated DNA repair dioxygenase AlkB